MSTQIRDVATYSPEEIQGFRERFAPLAKAFHTSMRRANSVKALFYFCWLLAAPAVLFPIGPVLFSLWLIGLIGSLIVFIRMLPKIPQCPACASELYLRTGAFCPNCGQRALYTPLLFGTPQSPKCRACKTSLFTMRKGGSSYRIHACNQCGLQLDERGF